MKLLLAILAAILAAAASPAPVSGQGINLSWDDCGAHGVELRTFACDTNVGLHSLVGSFIPGAYVDSVTGAEAAIDLQALGPSLPDWWMLGSDRCRPVSLIPSFDFTGGPFNCLDYWQGGALGAAVMDPPSGNRARIRVTMALPLDDAIAEIPDDAEVYAFKVSINSAKTVGPGACAGCDVGACVVLPYIQVDTIYDGQPLSFHLIIAAERNHVTWQCPGFTTTAGCVLDCTTPARSRTWGQIKQFYR